MSTIRSLLLLIYVCYRVTAIGSLSFYISQKRLAGLTVLQNGWSPNAARVVIVSGIFSPARSFQRAVGVLSLYSSYILGHRGAGGGSIFAGRIYGAFVASMPLGSSNRSSMQGKNRAALIFFGRPY